MSINSYATDLKLVRPSDGLEVDLAPLQGLWTEEQYLRLTDQTSRFIEFTDGSVEVLPMPTEQHQIILAFLYELFVALLRPFGGKVLFAPLRMRVREGVFREPDLLLMRDAHDPRRRNRFWEGADLVVEIVIPDDPERDIRVKRADYARAGIPEYWIVNPLDETITVLILRGDVYSEHGIFRRGDIATSVLLTKLRVPVAGVFDAR